MNIKEASNKSEQSLKLIYPKEEARQISRILLCDILGIDNTKLLLCDKEMPLTKEQESIFEYKLNRLSNNEPIQYVTGKIEFLGLEFDVSVGVLIPRPETEELCHIIINTMKEESGKRQLHILDFGCGSGCISISLAQHLFPAKVTATDLSPDAIRITQANAKKILDNSSLFKTVVCDMAEACENNELTGNKYDLIVSNPPYIRRSEGEFMRKNVLSYEPDMALFAPDEDPLYYYKAVARFADKYLKIGGFLCFEINESLGQKTLEAVESISHTEGRVEKDLFGKERFIFARKIR